MSIKQHSAAFKIPRWCRVAFMAQWALGAVMLLEGCERLEPQDGVDSLLDYSYGGIPNSYGGIPNSYGGIPNGGGGPTGLGWNGLLGAGQLYKGIGWNQATHSWTGPAWGGVTAAVDCSANGQPVGTVSTGADHSCTTLHNAFNHSDLDANGIVGESIDKATRLSALIHWTACACPNSVEIPFTDTHGWLPNGTTLYGILGLAPTWCGRDVSAVVPEAEMQIVSACMLALENTGWRHYNLSLRSTDASNINTVNEDFLLRKPLAVYWGNLWKGAHADEDTTSLPYSATSTNTSCSSSGGASDCNDLTQAGGTWWNMERFSCRGPRSPNDVDDQWTQGRDCEVSDCGGRLEWLGACDMRGKKLGNPGDWSGSGTVYQKAVDPSYLYDPLAESGGLTADSGFLNHQTPYRDMMNYRGKSWRAMEVWGPTPIPLEHPTATASAAYDAWTQIESGTIDNSHSEYCGPGLGVKTECDGRNGAYEKLKGLKADQAVTINFTGQGPLGTGSFTQGDPSSAVTVAIRYSRPGLLGDKQCDVSLGCAGTTAAQCVSSMRNPITGACAGGTANPGLLKIWLLSNKAYEAVWTSNPAAPLVNWQPVHGSIAPHAKNVFPTTFSSDRYSTAYIYPMYVQDSAATIPGFGGDHTLGGNTYDTLRVKLQGETGSLTDAPQLDSAYFFPGPPSADADCTGSTGCWLYAGPNQLISATPNTTIAVKLGQPGTNISPPLPPGSYTFKLKDVLGDLDLYVKKNGQVSESSWDCRPYLSRNQEEVCTLTLDKPGYFSAMVKGYANQTCNASAPYGCDCANFMSGCAAKGSVVGSN